MSERTWLRPEDESMFRLWAQNNGISDIDDPRSHYDYRGYFRDVVMRGKDQTQQFDDGLHFTDTYKQHGHPSFSVESQYSRGPHDGGRWLDDFTLVEPPRRDGMMRVQDTRTGATYGSRLDLLRRLLKTR